MTIVFDFSTIVLIAATYFLVHNLIGLVRSHRRNKEIHNRMQLMLEIQWCIELGLYETVVIKASNDSDLQGYVAIMKK